MTAAAARPASVNVESRSVDLLFSTGAAVERRGYAPDGQYPKRGSWIERLSLPGADLARLVNGPLLAEHDASLAAVLGVVETVKRDASGLSARVRFSRGPRAEAVWSEVRDGIIRSVSCGYRVGKWAKLGNDDEGRPIFEAVLWEPVELSMVAIPADGQAQVRGTNDTSPFLTRSLPMTTLQANEGGEPASLHNRTGGAAAGGYAPVEDRSEATAEMTRAAVAAENVRVRGIQATARDLNLAGPADRAEIERLLDDGVDLPTAKRALINLAAQRSQESGNRVRVNDGVNVGGIDTRAAIVSAIGNRLNPNVELVRGAEVYTQMPMAQLAEVVEREAGRGSWLGRSSPGYMGTSDFASVLALGTETAIAQAYQALPPALLPVARKFTVADLQQFAVLRPTTAPKLLEVNEHGEIKSAPLEASFETMSAKTFARMVNLSRNLVLADRLEILSDYVGMSARSAANTLGDLLHTALVGSPVMSDGVNFYATGHGNVSATGTTLNLAALEAAFIAMRSQQNGSEGSANVVPRYLVVGPSRELAGLQLLATIAATEVSQVSPYGSQLSLIVEPRITDGSFYVLADPARTAALGYAVLSGTRKMSSRDGVPLVDIREGWAVLGLEIRTVMDAGSAPLDWRSAYRNLGN